MNEENTRQVSEGLNDLQNYLKLRQEQQANTKIWNVLRKHPLEIYFSRLTRLTTTCRNLVCGQGYSNRALLDIPDPLQWHAGHDQLRNVGL